MHDAQQIIDKIEEIADAQGRDWKVTISRKYAPPPGWRRYEVDDSPIVSDLILDIEIDNRRGRLYINGGGASFYRVFDDGIEVAEGEWDAPGDNDHSARDQVEELAHNIIEVLHPPTKEVSPVTPSHYDGDGMQAIDVIDAFNLDFTLGNVVKYVLRAGRKGDRIEDLEKARWYLNHAINQPEQPVEYIVNTGGDFEETAIEDCFGFTIKGDQE